jgi:hypothetical protein
MGKKGLDTMFVHYGIRKEDMNIIESICNLHEIDFTWLRDDILKVYHEHKVKNQELTAKEIERLIEKALQKIK